MKTTPVTHNDLHQSVVAVPPLARTADMRLDPGANRKLIAHLVDGGVSTILYGGNANLYNIGLEEYAELVQGLPDWAPDDAWLIPSIGPSYGTALDHIALVKAVGYPTAMLLPLTAPATPEGVATAVRKIVERSGLPLVLYLKSESYLTVDLVADLVSDGLVAAIKYAVVRKDPSRDEFLDALLDRVDASLVISGIGERPAVVHFMDFGLQSFTSGSVCVAPHLATALLSALQDGRRGDAEEIREVFMPLEDLRDGLHPIRVLHEAVSLSGIADMGPILPMLSALDSQDRERVKEVARRLHEDDRAPR